MIPLNEIKKLDFETKKNLSVERITDEEKNFSQNNQQQYQEDFDQVEAKIDKLKMIIGSQVIDNLDHDSKIKLLQLVKSAAAIFLKKELLNVAKNIFSISLTKDIEDEMLKDEELNFSDNLAKFILKHSSVKRKNKESAIKDNIGKTNPLNDKNAGFLVHYCKDILNSKSKHDTKNHKLKKLNKKDQNRFLKNK